MNQSELPELETEDKEEEYDFIVLDESKKTSTADCKHRWSVDEELPHTKHWICGRCGLGKYSPIEPIY